MAVDSNFERFEEKLTHLVDVLGQLRQENTDLKTHVTALETEKPALLPAHRRNAPLLRRPLCPEG